MYIVYLITFLSFIVNLFSLSSLLIVYFIPSGFIPLLLLLSGSFCDKVDIGGGGGDYIISFPHLMGK